MAKYTKKLGLFKWDTANTNDLNEEFDIDEAINANWDKIDEAVEEKQTSIDNLEKNKANSADVYSRTNVDALLNNKVDKQAGKGLSTNDFSNTEKDKLAGIEAGANKTVVDNALSSSSTNPVQNKVVKEALDDKVNKETGKGLSTNDFSNADKTKLDGLENYDDTTLKNQMNNKVNKETGKGLSTNDFTDEEKAKLDILENYDDTTITEEILSLKSNKIDKEAGKGLSTNDFTNEEKAKLDELENYDDTEVRQKITAIETEQTTQNEAIEENTNKITANTEEIAKLKEENKVLKSQIPVRTSRRRKYHFDR